MKKIFLFFIVLVIISIVAFFIFWGQNLSTRTQKESLTIKGSDTEVQLVSNLAEEFSQNNEGFDISVTGGGSGVGIASLLNGEIDLANSSRQMKPEELDQAKSMGLDVQEFILAIDGLSIIVNPENKIENISFDQISRIYKGEIKDWKEIGGKDGKIVLYGRQSTSGTYNFFRDYVVKAEYWPEMKNMEGNQAIVDSVKADKNSIGYVGVGYVKDENNQPRKDIKILPVLKEIGGKAISPLDREAVKRGDYPISRQIFQYLPRMPVKNSLLDKFLHFEVSTDGQAIVEKAGFYPLTEADINKNQLLLP